MRPSTSFGFGFLFYPFLKKQSLQVIRAVVLKLERTEE